MKTVNSKSINFVYWAQIVVLGLIVGLGLQIAAAWTAPIVVAPGGSITAPLTTSGVSQTKGGSLLVGGNLTTTGVLYQDQASASYDIYIAGDDGTGRNLALLGLDNDSGDYLRINHANEYSHGTRINGKLSINTNAEPAVNLVFRAAGRVGADEFCDQNGGDCFVPTDVGAGANPFGTSIYSS